MTQNQSDYFLYWPMLDVNEMQWIWIKTYILTDVKIDFQCREKCESFWYRISFQGGLIYDSDAGRWKTLGVPVVIGGDNPWLG